jgi:hypothetical protein
VPLGEIGGCLAEDLLLQFQLGHALAQRSQLLLLTRGDAGRHAARLRGRLGAFRGADPVAQGLVVHPEFAGDVPQRAIRGPGQLDRILTELLGKLRRT